MKAHVRSRFFNNFFYSLLRKFMLTGDIFFGQDDCYMIMIGGDNMSPDRLYLYKICKNLLFCSWLFCKVLIRWLLHHADMTLILSQDENFRPYLHKSFLSQCEFPSATKRFKLKGFRVIQLTKLYEFFPVSCCIQSKVSYQNIKSFLWHWSFPLHIKA